MLPAVLLSVAVVVVFVVVEVKLSNRRRLRLLPPAPPRGDVIVGW